MGVLIWSTRSGWELGETWILHLSINVQAGHRTRADFMEQIDNCCLFAVNFYMKDFVLLPTFFYDPGIKHFIFLALSQFQVQIYGFKVYLNTV